MRMFQALALGVFLFCFPMSSILSANSPDVSPTAPELIQLMQRRFETLKDYQCQLTITSLKKGQTVVEANNYFFKKPKLIRLEVLTGNDKGAKCVLQKNGKVRAKAGGVLGLFTITMEQNDKRLQDGQGGSFVTTDFASVIKEIKQTLASGSATVTVVEKGRKLFQLDIERAGKRDLIVIDAAQQLPLQWHTFRNGKLENTTEWKNLRVDVGLADALFEL